MPADPTARQSDHASGSWFGSEAIRCLLRCEQRQAAPELARVYGQYGLFLRPTASLPGQLSGNLLHSMLSLHRVGRGLSGDVDCEDSAFPLASESLALIYAQHVLETSDDPLGLVAEVGRLLQPEGRAMFILFNPLAPFRLRWLRRGLRACSSLELGGMLQAVGLEVQSCRPLGVLWSARDEVGEGGRTWGRRLQSSYLLTARRREPGMTPLPRRQRRVALNPGMTPG